MPASSSIRQLILARKLTLDANQLPALAALERLLSELSQRFSSSLASKVKARFGRSSSRPLLKGVYLYGPVGRGKSMLMDLFYEALPIKRKKRYHFHHFMRQMHADLHFYRTKYKENALSAEQAISYVIKDFSKTCDVLCFDELHLTDIADAMLISHIISALLTQGIVLVITSNRHPHTLFEAQRHQHSYYEFITLLDTSLEVIAIEGPTDYRMQQTLSKAPHSYFPLGKEAENFIDRAFLQLKGENPITPVTLEIHGRSLTFNTCSDRVLMVEFATLCDQPLAAHDYEVICKRFDIILMRNIPLLTKDNRNQARRFIMLVDQLYEHKRVFYWTAASAPAELYTEGDGAFEFQRTVSRLMEMQSENYQAVAGT